MVALIYARGTYVYIRCMCPEIRVFSRYVSCQMIARKISRPRDSAQSCIFVPYTGMASVKRIFTGFSTSSFCDLCNWRAALSHRCIIQFYSKTGDFCSILLIFEQTKSTVNQTQRRWKRMDTKVADQHEEGNVAAIKQANSCRLLRLFVVGNVHINKNDISSDCI